MEVQKNSFIYIFNNKSSENDKRSVYVFNILDGQVKTFHSLKYLKYN